MNRIRFAAIGALTLLSAGCQNFLTGGELSNDPNRPVQATSAQLFVGIEVNVWATLQSDIARISNLWVQQLQGSNFQYVALYDYHYSESTTGGFYAGLYGGGGLYDIRKLEAQTAAVHDSLFLGITQVEEALLVGTGADLFGDIVYTQALKNTPNPPLDKQLTVYDSVQALLSRAIVNLGSSPTGPTQAGPGNADLSYYASCPFSTASKCKGYEAAEWAKVAHTLKARFYIHTAKVRPNAYAQALVETPLGLTNPSDNFNAIFSGNSGEQNLWYQFDVVARQGYISPDPQFVALLKARNDPRLAQYFNADQSDLATNLIQPNTTQALVTANEDVLLWSEAAQRTGDQVTALTELNLARSFAGIGPEPSGLTGQPVLAEILTEEYIADFQSIEAFNLYKRTCTPNLVPVTPGLKIPARFYYDLSERNTNTSLPVVSQQPIRNQADPASATSDATGQACLGQ